MSKGVCCFVVFPDGKCGQSFISPRYRLSTFKQDIQNTIGYKVNEVLLETDFLRIKSLFKGDHLFLIENYKVKAGDVLLVRGDKICDEKLLQNSWKITVFVELQSMKYSSERYHQDVQLKPETLLLDLKNMFIADRPLIDSAELWGIDLFNRKLNLNETCQEAGLTNGCTIKLKAQLRL